MKVNMVWVMAWCHHCHISYRWVDAKKTQVTSFLHQPIDMWPSSQQNFYYIIWSGYKKWSAGAVEIQDIHPKLILNFNLTKSHSPRTFHLSNYFQICSEQDSDTTLLSAKFQSDLTAKQQVMDFTRFEFNSLAPGRFQIKFRYVIFKLTLMNGSWGISHEIALRWIPLDLTDG